MKNKIRLDLFLLEKKIVNSRNKAKELILNNLIIVNNKSINKASFFVDENDKIEVEKNFLFVSRAAIKLEHAINYWEIDLKNKNVLDIGSSTGGFIEVCLKNGASFIYGIEVGHDQLDQKLKNNQKIKYYENLNFKNANKQLFDKEINYITCDVSFISCKKIIEKIIKLFNYKFSAIILIKPQFELEYDEITKYKGFVNDSKMHKKILESFKIFCKERNIKVLDIIESPIKGSKSGNKEFLSYLEFNYE
ncbi:MAG: TlyA family RNA methyltransferase [Mycoplasmoidaceae bacterium]